MTHRIKEIKTLDKFVVLAIFQDGTEKRYDISWLFTDYPQFSQLEKEAGLFESVTVDVGGYGISWNDELDLAAEEIWNNGENTGVFRSLDVLDEVGFNLTKARDGIGITQKELADKVKIYQGDISKIERGQANPSIKTLQRLAEGMGMRVKIEFVPKEK